MRATGNAGLQGRRCRRRPSGRLRLPASLSSVARSARSAKVTVREMTVLFGRTAAYIGAGKWDPARLGTAIATLAVVRIATRHRLVDGANNGQEWHVRR